MSPSSATALHQGISAGAELIGIGPHPAGSHPLLDTDQVPGRVADGAVAEAVELVGGLLDS